MDKLINHLAILANVNECDRFDPRSSEQIYLQYKNKLSLVINVQSDSTILANVVVFECIKVKYAFDIIIDRSLAIGNFLLKLLAQIAQGLSIPIVDAITWYNIVDRNSMNRRTRPSKYFDPAAISLYDYDLNCSINSLYTADTKSIVFAVEKFSGDKLTSMKKLYEYCVSCEST